MSEKNILVCCSGENQEFQSLSNTISRSEEALYMSMKLKRLSLQCNPMIDKYYRDFAASDYMEMNSKDHKCAETSKSSGYHEDYIKTKEKFEQISANLSCLNDEIINQKLRILLYKKYGDKKTDHFGVGDVTVMDFKQRILQRFCEVDLSKSENSLETSKIFSNFKPRRKRRMKLKRLSLQYDPMIDKYYRDFAASDFIETNSKDRKCAETPKSYGHQKITAEIEKKFEEIFANLSRLNDEMSMKLKQSSLKYGLKREKFYCALCVNDFTETKSKNPKCAETSISSGHHEGYIKTNETNEQILEHLRSLGDEMPSSKKYAKRIGLTNLENKFAKTLKSLNEKYDNIDHLKTSPVDECLKIVNIICKNNLSKIIDNLTKHNQLEKYQKSCLNCLHLSINIISKYIEKHRPSITVNYSNLLFVFDAFFDIISLNHLAERICESVLYTMCSILNIEGKKLIDKKWKDKLELCFHNNKINETIKLASSVILVQMDISNIELIQEIARYLFKNINIKYCQEDFGFTQSEINEARKNAIKKLFDNCENIKASSSLEICNAIVCDETNLKEIEMCVNEIKNEVIDEKNQ